MDDANFQIQRVERCNQNSILLHQKTIDIVLVRGDQDENDIVLYFNFWPKEEQCILLPLKLVIYQLWLSNKNTYDQLR